MPTPQFDAARLYPIGRITRTHGVGGEVEMAFTDDVFDRADAPFLFLELEGLPVPFSWEEYRFKGRDTVLFKFEDVDNESAARRLVGANVLYDSHYVPHTAAESTSLRHFVGYEVLLPDGRVVGRVTQVDDRSANILLVIQPEASDEVLLPFHPDLITHIDEPARQLTVDVPEALLSLNE